MDLINTRRRLLGGSYIIITWDPSLDDSYLNDNGVKGGDNSAVHTSNFIDISSGTYKLSFNLTTLTAKTFRVHEYTAKNQNTWTGMIFKQVVANTGKYEFTFQTQGRYIRLSFPKAIADCTIERIA